MQTYDIFIRAIKPFSLYYIPLGFSSLSSIAINHIIQSPTNNVEKNYFKIVPALHRETTFLAGPHPQPQGKMDKLKFEKNIRYESQRNANNGTKKNYTTPAKCKNYPAIYAEC